MTKSSSKNNYKEILERIEYLEDNFAVIMESSGDHKESEILDPSPTIEIASKNEVIIEPKAYLNMAAHAIKHANKYIPQTDWVEVIGLLTGIIRYSGTPLQTIIIKDYWPVGVGDAVSVNIMDAEPVMNVYKEKNDDEFIVGWAHSHPSYTPFLSKDDVATQLRYQALWNESLALVIDPEMINRNNHGFSVFRVAKDRKSYYELKYDVEGMSASASYEAISFFIKNLELGTINN